MSAPEHDDEAPQAMDEMCHVAWSPGGRVLVGVAVGTCILATIAGVIWLLLEAPDADMTRSGASTPGSSRPVLVEAAAETEPVSDAPTTGAPQARLRTKAIDPAAFVEPPPSRDTAEVSVRVLAPGGAPAPGALVVIGSAATHGFLANKATVADTLSHIKASESRPEGIQVAWADDEGKAEFRDVPPTRTLTVATWDPRFGCEASFSNAVVAGRRHQFAVGFRRAVVLTGFVMGVDGKPVEGAQVSVLPVGRGSDSPLETATTDADGRYETSGLAGDGFMLVFKGPSHFVQREHVRHVRPEETQRRINVWLEPAPLIRGRLVLEDGSPARVAEHLVALTDPRDPDARLALTLSFEDPCELRMLRRGQLDGRINARDDVYEVRPERKESRYVAITFKNECLGSARLPGKLESEGPDIVVDWSRAPPPEPRGTLTVLVQSRVDARPVQSYALMVESMASRARDPRSTFEVRSVDGRHRIEGLKQGVYRITASVPGFVSTTAHVEVKPDPVDNEVVLSVALLMSAITGRVVDASGDPIGGASVTAIPQRLDAHAAVALPGPTAVRSGPDGRFRIDDLALGLYGIVACAAGLAPASRMVSAVLEAPDVTVTLHEGIPVDVVVEGSRGPVRLTIKDSLGIPIVRGESGEGLQFDSRVTVRLRPGRYDALIGDPALGTTTRRFEVSRLMTLEVTLPRSPEGR